MSAMFAVLRFCVLSAPVGLAVLSVSLASRPWWFGYLVFIFTGLALYGTFVAAVEAYPGQLWLNGLRAFVAHGDQLRALAMRRAASARTTLKILDSYWGDIDQFREAIRKALSPDYSRGRLIQQT